MTNRMDAGITLPVVAASGREKAAEPSDPYVATAVALDTPGHDGLAAMARTFIVEFTLMGWSRERIRTMFTLPRLSAAYAVYRARGPEYIDELLDEVLGPADPATRQKER